MTNDAPAQASVEAVARIIDPKSWEAYDHAYPMQIGEFRRFADRVVKPSLATASEVLAALSPPPTVGAEDEASLFHVTGERITRKDLNNAYRSGQENGRLAAHLLDGAPAPAADGQRVKALRWSEPHQSTTFPAWHASFPLIRLGYSIKTGEMLARGQFALFIDLGSGCRGNWISGHDTLDEAKAAAQSDFEQRIRACLATDKEGA